MRGLPRFLIVLCLSVCVCAAQSTPTLASEIARARALLQSAQWVDKAWGAHLAISAHDDSLRDLLIDDLRRAQPLSRAPENTAEYAYVQSLFDALIQIGAELGSEAILPFERKWRPEALILLARQSGNGNENENALFSMMDEKPDWFDWFAINDLLARMHSQRFFRQTLEQMEIGHILVAEDTPRDFLRGGMSRLAGLATTRSNPKDFPPIGYYYLDGVPSQDGRMVVAGPRAVYYFRKEIRGGDTVPWSFLNFRNPADVKGAFSPVYLPHDGSDRDVDTIFSGETRIRWQGVEEFSKDAQAALSDQADSIRSFIGEAHRHGLGDVSGITLKIVPTLEDHRRTASGPLPAVTPWVIVLQ
jgi:hypothetical protein